MEWKMLLRNLKGLQAPPHVADKRNCGEVNASAVS
jgi:hypothetical protein